MTDFDKQDSGPVSLDSFEEAAPAEAPVSAEFAEPVSAEVPILAEEPASAESAETQASAVTPGPVSVEPAEPVAVPESTPVQVQSPAPVWQTPQASPQPSSASQSSSYQQQGYPAFSQPQQSRPQAVPAPETPQSRYYAPQTPPAQPQAQHYAPSQQQQQQYAAQQQQQQQQQQYAAQQHYAAQQAQQQPWQAQRPTSQYYQAPQHTATPASAQATPSAATPVPTQAATAQHQRVTPQPNAPKRPAASKGLAFVMGLIGVLVGAMLTFGSLYIATDGFAFQTTIEAPPAGNYSNTSLTITPPSEDASLAEVVAAKALPSIVNIDVYTTSRGGYYGDSGSQNSGALEEYGLGSGVVISSDGYILTNYHVVEGGDEYLVRFSQDEQYKATVVGEDPTSDLAVLKVDANNLTPIEIGDSSKAAVGQWVMALGSPFGLEKSVSTGIVSALFRSTSMESTTGVNFYANLIQTDAAINPGNSGGALVNAEGKLIGINTLISSSSGTSSGVGFAIPSNYAMNVAQQIMDGKKVEHAYLGVQVRTIDIGNASSFNADVNAGAYVDQIVAGSPAASAGLEVGDIVTKMDDTPISSAAELMINVRGHLLGDTVTLEIHRGGSVLTVDVTLGSDNS